MTQVRASISMSLDGYVAGPNQSLKEPLGEGGEGLHEWIFPLRYWFAMLGKDGGKVNESNRVLEEQHANVGATIMGRNMFGGGPGPWNEKEPWKGWWGDTPPYHHPVFVLTHHPRKPLEMKGGTTFTFVTDGIESALSQARRSVGSKDVHIAGGATAIQQALRAGAVDILELNVSPRLLGGGARLFDNVGTDLHGLSLERTIGTPEVVHLKFVRR